MKLKKERIKSCPVLKIVFAVVQGIMVCIMKLYVGLLDTKDFILHLITCRIKPNWTKRDPKVMKRGIAAF